MSRADRDTPDISNNFQGPAILEIAPDCTSAAAAASVQACGLFGLADWTPAGAGRMSQRSGFNGIASANHTCSRSALNRSNHGTSIASKGVRRPQQVRVALMATQHAIHRRHRSAVVLFRP
jgi:hypothetical protein